MRVQKPYTAIATESAVGTSAMVTALSSLPISACFSGDIERTAPLDKAPGVIISPGATELTVMPKRFTSLAISWVMETTPPLEEA